MNVLEVVEDILDRHQINYHNLLVTNVATRNVIITDSLNVFVKMKGMSKSLQQFKADIDFYNQNPSHGFELLIPNLVHPFKRGLEGTFSVWKYEQSYPLAPSVMTVDQATLAARKLAEIHSTPRYGTLLKTVDDLIEPMAEHLQSIQFRALRATNQHKLKKLFETVVQPALWLAAPPVLGSVVSHGNALPDKIVVKRNGQISWSDFETVRLTRPEYDLATLKLSLQISGTNFAAWEAIETEYRKHFPELNNDIMNQFMGMMVCSQVIEVASQVLDHHQEAGLEELLDKVEPLLYGEFPFVLRLPAIRNSLAA